MTLIEPYVKPVAGMVDLLMYILGGGGGPKLYPEFPGGKPPYGGTNPSMTFGAHWGRPYVAPDQVPYGTPDEPVVAVVSTAGGIGGLPPASTGGLTQPTGWLPVVPGGFQDEDEPYNPNPPAAGGEQQPVDPGSYRRRIAGDAFRI